MPAFEAAIAEQRKEIDAIVANAERADVRQHRGGARRRRRAARQGDRRVLQPRRGQDQRGDPGDPGRGDGPEAVRACATTSRSTRSCSRGSRRCGPSARLLEARPASSASCSRRPTRGSCAAAPTWPPSSRSASAPINQELSASLSVRFADNLLAETNAYSWWSTSRRTSRGCRRRSSRAAAEAAKAAGLEGKWVFTLQPPRMRPFLAYADNRELRRKIFDGVHDPRRPRRRAGQQRDRRAHRGAARRAGAAARLRDLRRLRARGEHGEDPGQRLRAHEQALGPGGGQGRRGGADLQAMIDEEHRGLQDRAVGLALLHREGARRRSTTSTRRRCARTSRWSSVREGAFGVATRLYGLTFTERHGHARRTTPRCAPSR